MGMVQLNELLPLSSREYYWTFYGKEHEGLPDDKTYVIFEYYCDNPACQCENLIADIMQIGADGEHIEKPLATVKYDWSSKKSRCYPTLTEHSPKTKLAYHLLETYKKFIHYEEYLTRIKSQYARVKQLVLERGSASVGSGSSQSTLKLGRNDPCYCGSGIKFKKCCLQKRASSK